MVCDVLKKEDRSLTCGVYRKPTHMDRYLHSRSFHHSKIKSSVNQSLVSGAYNVCNEEALGKELHHISKALQCNGYKARWIKMQEPPPAVGSPIPKANQLIKAPSPITIPLLRSHFPPNPTHPPQTLDPGVSHSFLETPQHAHHTQGWARPSPQTRSVQNSLPVWHSAHRRDRQRPPYPSQRAEGTGQDSLLA